MNTEDSPSLTQATTLMSEAVQHLEEAGLIID